MSVKIRLQRKGSKKRPFYRVVVQDSRSAVKSEKVIQNVGTYNPTTEPAEVNLKEEEIMEWLHNGAKPSDTVRALLSQAGLMERFHNEKNTK